MFTPDDFIGYHVTENDDPATISEQVCGGAPTLSSQESVDISTQRVVHDETPGVATTEPSTSKSKINIISCVKLTTPLPKNSSVEKHTPEDIRPYPKAVRIKKRNNGRKKRYSAILTETPEKDRIESEQNERENKRRCLKEKKAAKQKSKKTPSHIRKVFPEETSESENDEFLCQESGDSPTEEENSRIINGIVPVW